MAMLEIRDDALWAKHIDDADIRRYILALPAEAAVDLRIAGRRMRFRKMRTGRDGRPTPGLRADSSARAVWAELQVQRGTRLPIELLKPVQPDPYLESLTPLLGEWLSEADCEAFDGL